jgi:hypothetical protein
MFYKELKTDHTYSTKKSLKIPKRQSETVYRRRTDSTMAKKKSTKGKTKIYKHTYTNKKTLHKTKEKRTLHITNKKRTLY